MTHSKQNTMSFIDKLILLVLILTPVFSFQEALALIMLEQRGTVHTSNILSSIYLKGLKDVFFILIIFSSALIIMQTLKINRGVSIFLAVILFFIILPAYYYHDNILVFLSGIRWLMPFILAAFLINQIDKKLLYKIATILFYLFIIHLIMQIIQLFFSYGYFGLNTSGLSSRNPGIFYIPSTAAAFAIIVLFFCQYYMNEKLQKKIFYLIPISIFLTASGTGIGIYVIFMLIYYLRNGFLPYLPIILVSMATALFLLLDLLTGRSGLVEESLGIRFEHFQKVLIGAHYLPQDFGYGTATAELIVNKFNNLCTLETQCLFDFDMIITHSWYASSIVNLGIINSILILIAISVVFVVLTRSKDKEKLLFLTIYGMFALTTPIAESYPANLIFAVLLAYYIRPKESNFEPLHTSNNILSTTRGL